MNEENQISALDYNWWGTLSGYIIFFLFCVVCLYVWLELYNEPAVDRWNLAAFLLPTFFYILSLPRLIKLFFVPKSIIFNELSIIVVTPLNKKEILDYNNISKIIIVGDIKKNLLKWCFFYPYNVSMFLLNYKKRVYFNLDLLVNYQDVFEYIRNKGLGNVIEWK